MNADRIVYETINQVREYSGYSIRDFSEAISIAPSRFRRFLHSGGTRVPLDIAGAFAVRSNISLDAVLKRRVDCRVAAQCFRGEKPDLPAIYRTSFNRSRMRTALNALEGSAVVKRIDQNSVLKYVQVDKALLQNPSQLVSPRLKTYICERLASLGMQEHDFYRAGLNTVSLKSNSEVKKALSNFKTPQKLMEQVFGDLLQLWDQNHDYVIRKSSSNLLKVDISRKSEILESHDGEGFGNRYTDAERNGTISAMTIYAGFLPAKTVQTASEHQGDSKCHLEIYLN